MKTKSGKSLTTRIFLVFNSLAVAGLLLVYLGVLVNPATFWPFAFAGFLYPVLFVVNVLFVLFWLIRFKAYFLISLLTILIGWEHVQSFIQFNHTHKPLPQEGKNIKILSYNVKVFDLYNYGPRWELNFTERNNIFRFLQEEEFDIICFQEFVHDATGKFKTLDTLPLLVKANRVHTVFNKSSRNINFFGLATFSAYPIVNKGEIEFPTQMGNLCIYSDIKIGSDTIRVYNVHFESIGLSPEDYVFVESISNPGPNFDTESFKKGGQRILNRMRKAFNHRASQVETVMEHIQSCPYPVVLAGDFNDIPASWAYRKASGHLSDAFGSGSGMGQTYISNIPGLRIDYIFHSDEFTPYNFTTGKHNYSDHYPIWTWLYLPP
ncbi:MAG: endonuclease/exonuclease/phosphatase family protein [Bacteroidota bacterium]